MRKMMRNTMLGMALVAGLMGTGAAVANATPRGFDGRGDRGYGRPGVERNFVRRDYGRPVGRVGFGVAVGGPVYGGAVYGGPVVDAYIPPSPGDGYEWAAGYYNGGIWVPGAWRIRAGYRGFGGGVAYGRGFDRDGRGYDRGGRGGYDRDFHGRR
jgi:hypothetical protein